MSNLDKKVAQAMGFKSVNNCEQWKKSMIEEDDDTQVYKKPWVGLTNNELQPIADEYRILFGGWVEDFARAIEAKLKEKNT